MIVPTVSIMKYSLELTVNNIHLINWHRNFVYWVLLNHQNWISGGPEKGRLGISTWSRSLRVPRGGGGTCQGEHQFITSEPPIFRLVSWGLSSCQCKFVLQASHVRRHQHCASFPNRALFIDSLRRLCHHDRLIIRLQAHLLGANATHFSKSETNWIVKVSHKS